MSVDISQFYQVFFEESLEGLDSMETALMALDPKHIDAETINTIFRAAHSIKGGSATFGFSEVAAFTHVLETLLDEVREGSRGLATEHVDLLLRSVDAMRQMIETLQSGETIDTSASDELKIQFEAILQGDAATSAPDDISASLDAPEKAANGGWQITFTPHADMLRTGNEPIRMFRELAELGDLSIVCHTDKLPTFDALSPEECHLSWTLTLRGEASLEDVQEVFEWVEDEADIAYASLAATAPVQGFIDNAVAPGGEDVVASPAAGASEKMLDDMLVDASLPAEVTPIVRSDTASSKVSTPAPAAKAAPKAPVESSIRVGTDKIDQLINLVGELVITQSMLGQLGEGDSDDFSQEKLLRLQEGLSQLEQNTRELQESVMRIRMLPISFTFSRFPRMVRDLSQRLNKKIDLVLQGEQTELDKTVMEKIGDPLVHLVRNSVDHGIESPDVRLAAGKPETGVVTLNAYHQGGNVVIEIRDDGAGLNKERIHAKALENGVINPGDNLTDEQVFDLIFQPGFSTAQEVSDVSGRGVGMDVVRRNIQELNGSVDVKSQPGKGSTFTIRLPLTLAILDGQLVRVGTQNYIFPLVSIVESIQVSKQHINQMAGGSQVLRLRDEYIPIVYLHEVYATHADLHGIEEGLVVVVEFEGGKYGVVVDDLLAQQQVVIKSLETNYRRVEGVSGATILGDGTVALIVDIAGIVKMGGAQQAMKQIESMVKSMGKAKVA
ncbi:MAG: hypothetical protein RL336_1745 [Pseudomonadota bacterium]|jgi:two-component system chemotaxis sensor kinase CheA